MRIHALSDPHLSFGTPGKEMDVFGPEWHAHAARMAAAWDAAVGDDDLVLVPGDISWARKLEQAEPDLAWLAERPGTKVLAKGNHDSWWQSQAKVDATLPAGMHALDGRALRLGDVALCAARLWDAPGIDYGPVTVWRGEPISPPSSPDALAAQEKIFRRQLGRLDRALAELGQAGDGARLKVAITHYPPVGPDPEPNELTARFEAAGVAHVVFGHLHALDRAARHRIGGTVNGVAYHLTSCDWIEFRPTLIAELP